MVQITLSGNPLALGILTNTYQGGLGPIDVDDEMCPDVMVYTDITTFVDDVEA